MAWMYIYLKRGFVPEALQKQRENEEHLFPFAKKEDYTEQIRNYILN